MIILTWDVTFLQKSYGEYTKVEKSVLVTMSYEGSNDEEEHKTIPIVNNTNVNIVSETNSYDNIKNSKQSPKPLSMQKWSMQ